MTTELSELKGFTERRRVTGTNQHARAKTWTKKDKAPVEKIIHVSELVKEIHNVLN